MNHSKEFVNRDTGAHTNHVEGLHGVLKRDGRSHFGCLPYLIGSGDPYYLYLLVFRANARLKKIPVFYHFCNALHKWTHNPLQDWNCLIPVVADGDKQSEEDDNIIEDILDYGHVEGDWLINRRDLVMLDDSDDEDFVP